MPRILELFANTSWLRMMRHKFRKGTMLFHEDNMTQQLDKYKLIGSKG